jgi:hypothetical protein
VKNPRFEGMRLVKPVAYPQTWELTGGIPNEPVELHKKVIGEINIINVNSG